MAESKTNFDELSVAEKILRIQDLWDQILPDTDQIDLTPAQQRELKRRLEAHRYDPTAGSTWEEVKRRIRSGQ